MPLVRAPSLSSQPCRSPAVPQSQLCLGGGGGGNGAYSTTRKGLVGGGCPAVSAPYPEAVSRAGQFSWHECAGSQGRKGKQTLELSPGRPLSHSRALTHTYGQRETPSPPPSQEEPLTASCW